MLVEMRATRLFFGMLVLASAGITAFVGTEGCSSEEFAAADASTKSDASDGGAHFCTGHPEATLCEDFDLEPDGSQFDPRWQPLVVGGTLTRSNDAVSAPAALLASLKPATGATTALLSYNANLSVVHQLDVRAKVKIEPNCANALWSVFTFAGLVGGIGVTVSLITFPTASPGTTLALYSEAKIDGGKKMAAPGAIDVALGSWTDVSFRLDFDAVQADGGKGTNITATYGGVTIFDLKGAEGAALGTPLFVIGTSADSPTTSCTIHYDDVLYVATK